MVGTGAPSETFGACVARIRNKTVLARNYSVALHSVFSLFENVNTHIHTDMERRNYNTLNMNMLTLNIQVCFW